MGAFGAIGVVLAILDILGDIVDWSRVHELWHIDDAVFVGFFLLLGFAVLGKLREDQYERVADDYEQTLAALEASEQKWRRTFESAASGTAIISMRDGRFIAVNNAITEATGYSKEQLQSMSIRDILHPDDLKASETRIRAMLSGHLPSSRSSGRYLDRNGHTKYALISSAPLGVNGNEAEQLVAQLVDITDQVRAEQRLKELMEQKDKLIASVAHEIRTPLSAVVGFSQLLNEDVSSLTAEERKEMIATIANEGADLADIVEDLLVEARADGGTLTLAKVQVDLLAQTRQTLEALDRDMPPDMIRITESSVLAVADPARVRQIIRNLITNALRYGGDRIHISCDEQAEAVSLIVSDNGPGVPLSDRKRIFEPYERAHDRPGLTSSIGLGLSVSRKLARMMDGDLTYGHSNGWSVFRLELPAALYLVESEQSADTSPVFDESR